MTNRGARLAAIAGAIALAVGIGSAPEAQAQEIRSRLCQVDQVAVFASRIHIKCAPDGRTGYTNDILYYAMAISADARAARVIDNTIALAIGAKQTGKPMVLWFDYADYRSVPGCQGNDCRKLTGAALE